MQLHDNTLLQGGKYKILRFIGAGGFGCTYEAQHTLLDSRVALKEFFVSDFCNRDERTGLVTVATQSKVNLVDKLKKKFVEEARALFSMKHPGIVRVIDVFEENGTAYYAMEYIDGLSLSDIVKQRGKLPETEAVGYIRQVAEALKYVHGLNRLHLDIKPGNIMLNSDGKTVLIDFGASKHYDDETGENTSTLLGVNTKGYAPVEQVNQSFISFSPATDIYALGATLYKLLTGITPPPSTAMHAEEATLPPMPSGISCQTRQAITAAMQLLRKNRPQTMEQWITLLPPDSTDSEQTLLSDKREEAINKYEKKTTTRNNKTGNQHSPHGIKWKKWAIGGSIIAAFIILLSTRLSREQISNNGVHDNREYTYSGSIHGHEYVDLGLSVKWAACNIGAATPSDYGNYFAWGETSMKTDYTIDNCKTYQQKLGDIAGNTQYDAARACWGGTWRLPTKAEYDELINKCTWKWTFVDGHNGYRIISKINGVSIFLPAAGYCHGTSLLYSEGIGTFWCSTSDSDSPGNGCCLYFDSDQYFMDQRSHRVGFSVRPVSE